MVVRGCTGGGGTTPGIYGGWIWVRDWATSNIVIDLNGNLHGNFASEVMPAFANGWVFYTNEGAVAAVDVATDVQKWLFKGDSMLCSSAVVAGKGKQVFVASSTGTIYEIDETTGAMVSSDAAGMQITCGPEGGTLGLAGNHLFVPAGNQLVAY